MIVVAPGDYGKPRPAAVVQSDLFNETHASVVVCPITTHLIQAPLFRLPLAARSGTGLRQPSQLMVDKLIALRRDRVRKRVGSLSTAETRALDEALALWLGLETNG